MREIAESNSLKYDDDQEGLSENAHLLGSPKNVERLLKSLERARSDEGTPQTLEELKREVGLVEGAENEHKLTNYIEPFESVAEDDWDILSA